MANKPDVCRRKKKYSAQDIIDMDISKCCKIECDIADDLDRYAR